MTKGIMVLELLIYAKSALKNFDQSEASIMVMWLPKEAPDPIHILYLVKSPVVSVVHAAAAQCNIYLQMPP